LAKSGELLFEEFDILSKNEIPALKYAADGGVDFRFEILVFGFESQ